MKHNSLARRKFEDFRDYNQRKFLLMQKQKELVWVDNDISESCVMPYTKRQLKIIDYAITEVKKQNITSSEQKVKIAFIDIIRYLGQQKSGQLLKDIEKDVLYIKAISCWWRYDYTDPRKKVAFSFFEKAHEIEDSEKTTFTLQFNQEFLNKLYNTEVKEVCDKEGNIVKIGFNNYEIWNTKNLKTKYGILLFKKCNQFLNKGEFFYKVEDMRKDFMLYEKSFGYISSHCLEVAKRDINNNSDIEIKNIECYPNKKRVDYVKISCRRQKDDIIDLITDDVKNDIIKTIDEEDKQRKNFIMDRSVERECINDDKKHEETIKKRFAKEFENILKENKEKIENKEVEIFELIKEHETRTGKVFCQSNIEYFVSEKLYEEIEKEMYEKRKETYKEKDIDYDKYLKQNRIETKEIFKKSQIKTTPYAKKNNHKGFIINAFREKYGVFDDRKWNEYLPEQQEQFIDENEENYKDLINRKDITVINSDGKELKMPTREEIRQEFIDMEKETEEEDFEIDESIINEIDEAKIERMKEMIEKYEKIKEIKKEEKKKKTEEEIKKLKEICNGSEEVILDGQTSLFDFLNK